MATTANSQIALSDILSALSYALDLTEGQPESHCVRCCHIGMTLGRHIGLDEEILADLYYTLLLKDLGCSSNAARICSLYLTDDRTFKRDFKQVDGSLSQVLRFVLNNTGMQAGMATRFRALYKIMTDGGEISRSLIETRCQRGADIALKMRFSQRVADAILSLDEHWDGSGQPQQLSGSDIPLLSQIALVAQVVDVFNVNSGREAALHEITTRAASWFSPKLVAAFETVAASDAFWEALGSEELSQTILALEPARYRRTVDEAFLDDIAEAFAQIVDAKSPFTAGHSERVTVFADLIAAELGYSQDRRRWLRRAALLHDIGKLAISNTILDKPGKLTDSEFATVKSHPVHSREILARIKVFEDLAPVAGGHHEKLDGSGYPDGLKGGQIDMDTRIVTVADIFDALTADRPYRGPMPEGEAMAIMDRMAGEKIDTDCLDALKTALDKFSKAAA